MNNQLLQIKFKQRLNKLASNDYDNIECWQILEIFNKVQKEWARRQLGGVNLRKEGAESSLRRIDDLQVLLKTETLKGTLKDQYFETVQIPGDYLAFSRVKGEASHPGCVDPRTIVAYLAEEANVDELMRSTNTCPSFEWAESFCTLAGNQVRFYCGDAFKVSNVTLTYYRQPRDISISGCVDPSTGKESLGDVTCEFKDDIIEILIDEAAAVAAADLENFNQSQRNKQNAEGNN